MLESLATQPRKSRRVLYLRLGKETHMVTDIETLMVILPSSFLNCLELFPFIFRR
jgi:hypothetical protein